MKYRETRFCENFNIASFETHGEYNIPIIKPYQYEPTEFIGFNFAKSTKEKRKSRCIFSLMIINLKDYGESQQGT